MKTEDPLYLLIHSLTKNEKGYFKKFVSKHTEAGKNKYVKLFNIIEKQKKYDENKLKSVYQSNSGGNSLSSAKNYLYQSILKSLRSYYDENTIESTIKNYIKNIELLYRKALFKQCEEYIAKALELANKHEKHLLALETYSYVHKIRTDQLNEKEFAFKEEDEILVEQQKHIKIYNNLVEYRHLLRKYLISLSKSHSNADHRQQIDQELFTSALLNENIIPVSNQAGLIYHNLLAGIELFFKKNTAKASEYYSQYLDYFDANEHLKREESESYFKCLRSLIQIQLGQSQFPEYENTLTKLKAISTTDSNSTLKLFECQVGSELIYYIFSAKIKEGVRFLEKNESIIHEHSSSMNKSSLLAMYDSISLLLFFNENYSKSLVYVNHIINSKVEMRADVKCFAYIMSLLIHYELDHLDHIEYLLKSYKKYIKKHIGQDNYAWPILNFMEETVQNPKEKEIIQNLIRLKEKLIFYKNSPQDEMIFKFFDLTLWPQSKIEKTSLRDLIIENLK